MAWGSPYCFQTAGRPRRTLRTSLVAEGFRGIKDVSELYVLRDIVDKGLPDVIVLDLDMPDGDASRLHERLVKTDRFATHVGGMMGTFGDAFGIGDVMVVWE